MNNISSIKNCYGCGVCSIICPEQIISLTLSSDGFYEPLIKDMEACTECGLCLSVCAFNNIKIAREPKEIKAFSGWSNNKSIRDTCSSGGIGYEIGRLLIEKGYKACAVRYNVEMGRAEHYIADSVEKFKKSKGSKYLQSFTIDGFKELNTKDKYVVFGTPCQIDSIRRFIMKMNCENNFVLVDFFCHGVPSYRLWNSYINHQRNHFKLGDFQEVIFRSKKFGWHSYTIMISGTEGQIYSSTKNDDIFYRLFLGDYCLNLCCYSSCKYKLEQSSADIRIGDFWGKKFKTNCEGVSGILSFTDLGESIIKDLQTSCFVQDEKISTVTEGQMRMSPKIPLLRRMILNNLEIGKAFGSFILLVFLNFLKYRNKLYHFPKKLLIKLHRK